MEGRRRMSQMGEIKKGPWKAEEDQVLMNHVRKHGPRDWSSIRSKGLLSRTGKSCRLRWVNKLRPDLKTGVKFSAEEERIVIELQAEFGNKWARISTYLPGRTDNDVKNFWSSRQKRLARMLHNTPNTVPSSSSSSSSSAKPRKNTAARSQPPISYLDIPSLEAPKFSSSPEKQPIPASSSIIANSEMAKMVPFAYPDTLIYEPNLFQLDKKPTIISDEQQQVQPEFPLPIESQDDIITRLGEPNFLNEFENPCGPVMGPDISCLIDGFPPIDIFDHIPSPSDWSCAHLRFNQHACNAGTLTLTLDGSITMPFDVAIVGIVGGCAQSGEDALEEPMNTIGVHKAVHKGFDQSHFALHILKDFLSTLNFNHAMGKRFSDSSFSHNQLCRKICCLSIE
ncbi:R2r3-myb transcription factor [Striga asiatica]|uniref:R2r3-myb transcription factor n=1 Tax=Striga asiatica TaxID=4170 RepID=A0A5A7P3L4_STRAF|nr:R2r3-myb transcription factor [Striga asiatica]